MTRGICVCGKAGYVKCTVHGDPVKGVGVTDGEFKELIVRHKGAILEIFAVGEVVPMKKIGRLIGKGAAR
jgi:hypothetical protein